MNALIEDPSTQAIPAAGADGTLSRPVEGSSVGETTTPYEQRKLTCRLKDCAATVTFSTHQMSDGLYVSGEALLPIRQRGYSSARQVTLVFVIQKLDGRCYIARNKWEDTIWLNGASFKIDARDKEGAFEFLASIGVRIDDERAK